MSASGGVSDATSASANTVSESTAIDLTSSGPAAGALSRRMEAIGRGVGSMVGCTLSINQSPSSSKSRVRRHLIALADGGIARFIPSFLGRHIPKPSTPQDQ